jgi:hypothetical protein
MRLGETIKKATTRKTEAVIWTLVKLRKISFKKPLDFKRLDVKSLPNRWLKSKLRHPAARKIKQSSSLRSPTKTVMTM